MLLRSSLKWLVSGALVVFVAGSATAQPTGGGGGGTGGASVGLKQTPTISLPEQVAQIEASTARMEQASTVVRRQHGAAREARDVVKTLCLNDKLSQIDVAIRSARDRRASHAAAVARNDAELAGHEFTIHTVLRQRTESLTAEANQCIGEELAFTGKTEVITQVDPTLPGNEQTDPPATDPTLISAPPIAVSSNGK